MIMKKFMAVCFIALVSISLVIGCAHRENPDPRGRTTLSKAQQRAIGHDDTPSSGPRRGY